MDVWVGKWLNGVQYHRQTRRHQVIIKNVTKVAIILLHAFIGWALCAATIGIGMAVTELDTVLVVHAIAAPVFFTLVSPVYFHRFNNTTPLMTTIKITAFVSGMNLFVAALLVNRSLEMFQ